MIQSTTNYAMFKFTNKNREKGIDPAHVRKLVNSIKAKNMLEMKPIIVNENMEIVEGQHRTMAAKELGVPIYYTVVKSLSTKEMIGLNTQKSWRTGDVVNAYVREGRPEYIKLQEFCKKAGVAVTVGITLVSGRFKDVFEKIREGDYVFAPEADTATKIEECHQVIDIIKANIGTQHFMQTTKFWKALVAVVKDPYYVHAKMIHNIRSLISRIGIRASYKEYLNMFCNVHNYRNQSKIDFSDSNPIKEGQED